MRGRGRRFQAPGYGRNRQPSGDKPGSGPNGWCVCTNSDCNYRTEHIIGRPCNQHKCPKCGSPLTKE